MADKKMSITLPEEMVALVAAKVASGEYNSESEVILDGLRTLLKRDAAVESWLQNRVAHAYDHLKDHSESALSGDQIRGELYRLVSSRNRNTV
jgi:antitoxin ParD1/3/4